MTRPAILPMPQRDRDGNIFVKEPDGTRHVLHPLHASQYALAWASIVGGAYVGLMTRPALVEPPCDIAALCSKRTKGA